MQATVDALTENVESQSLTDRNLKKLHQYGEKFYQIMHVQPTNESMSLSKKYINFHSQFDKSIMEKKLRNKQFSKKKPISWYFAPDDKLQSYLEEEAFKS